MKIIFHEDQRFHDPKHYLSSGSVRANPETPGRIDALLAGGVELELKVAAHCSRRRIVAYRKGTDST